MSLFDLHLRHNIRYFYHAAAAMGIFRPPYYIFLPKKLFHKPPKEIFAVLYHEIYGHASLAFRHPTGLSFYLLIWLSNLLLRVAMESTSIRDDCINLASEIQEKVNLLQEGCYLTHESTHCLLIESDPIQTANNFVDLCRQFNVVIPLKSEESELRNYIFEFNKKQAKPALLISQPHRNAYLTLQKAVDKTGRHSDEIIRDAFTIDFSLIDILGESLENLKSLTRKHASVLVPDKRLKEISKRNICEPIDPNKSQIEIQRLLSHPRLPILVRDRILELIPELNQLKDAKNIGLSPLDKSATAVLTTPFGILCVLVPYLEKTPPYQTVRGIMMEDFARENLAIARGLISLHDLYPEDRAFLEALNFVIENPPSEYR